MRQRFVRRAVRLSLVLLGTATASPVAGQVVVVRRDTTAFKRDSNATFRILRTGGQDSLMLRIDSLFRRLDHEPLGSVERAQLEANMERMMTELTALVGARGEFNIRVGRGLAGAVSSSISRAFVESGEGLRQLRGAMPQGWIGIIAEGPRVHRMLGDREIVHYFGYPSIVSVEANSPAERAGIVAGDTLVAYNGAEVRDREINLSQLLIPDKKLAVTIRRDGDTKEYTMTVAKAPENFVRQRFDGLPVDSLFGDGRVFVPMPRELAGRAGTRPQVTIERAPPGMRPPGMPISIAGSRLNDASRSVWGAQLATIDEGLGRTLGVKSGVLVTAVASATPASKSGLESGDIIIRLDGHRLVSVDDVWRAAVEHRVDHAVELQVQRAKKAKKITVRWE